MEIIIALKKNKPTPEEREKMICEVIAQMMVGSATTGQLLTALRKKYLQMRQSDYAKLVGVSLRTLSNIENDIGDQTISSINKAFRPFGISVGLWPKDIEIIKSAVKKLEEIVYEKEQIPW